MCVYNFNPLSCVMRQYFFPLKMMLALCIYCAGIYKWICKIMIVLIETGRRLAKPNVGLQIEEIKV